MAIKVLGFKFDRTLRHHFTPDELSQIEAEALEIRRSKYAPQIAKIDRALLFEAEGGDTKAVRLAYQRFEDWAPKKRTEVTGKDGGPLEIALTWPENGNGDDDT